MSPDTGGRDRGRDAALERWVAPSTATRVDQVDLDEIHAGWRPERTHELSVDAAVATIRAVGIIEPVLLRPRAAGGFELVTGHRMVEAARAAGLDRVPATVRLLDDAQALQAMATDGTQSGRLTHAGALELRERLHQAGVGRDGIKDVFAAVGMDVPVPGAPPPPLVTAPPAPPAPPASRPPWPAPVAAEPEPAGAGAEAPSPARPLGEQMAAAPGAAPEPVAAQPPAALAGPPASLEPAAAETPQPAPTEPAAAETPQPAPTEPAAAEAPQPAPAEPVAAEPAATPVAEEAAAAGVTIAPWVVPAAPDALPAAAAPASEPQPAAPEPQPAASEPEPTLPAPPPPPPLPVSTVPPARRPPPPGAAAPLPTAPPSRWIPLPAGAPRLARLSSAFADAPRMLRLLAADGFTGTVELTDAERRRDCVFFASGKVLAVSVERSGQPALLPLRLPAPDRGPGVEITVRPHAEAIVVALALALRAPARLARLDAAFVDLRALLGVLRRERASAACVVSAPRGSGAILLSDGRPVAAYARRHGEQPGEEAETGDLDAVAELFAEGEGEVDVHDGELPRPLDLDEIIAAAVPAG